MQGSQGEGAGLCLQDMYQNTAYYVYDTLLMVGRGEETWKSMWGQGAPSGDRTGVKACLLLSREDSVATECTRDEELPVLQGQVPLHNHVQGDLVGVQALRSHQQLQVLWPDSLVVSMSSKYLQVITKMLKILVQALLHHLKSHLLHGHLSIEAEKLSIVAQSCLVRILAESGASSSGPGRMPG